MTTDEQVRILIKELEKGRPLTTAAAKAGMSRPTARKWRDSGKRRHRTRKDPLAGVWEEAEGLLEQDPGLQAKTVFEELRGRHPGCLEAGQLRTFQRRVVGAQNIWTGSYRVSLIISDIDPSALCARRVF